LFTTFCPLIDQVEYGRLDADGMPNYITLTLKAWKHNADGKLTQQLLIKRNMMHPAYCPVFTLVATVEISSRYPLFSVGANSLISSQMSSFEDIL